MLLKESMMSTHLSWQLGLPCYTKGKLASTLYNCGSCLYEGKSDGKMHLITETTANEFMEWCQQVLQSGITKTYSYEIDGNLYRGFRSVNGERYYAYYHAPSNKELGEVRVILEPTDSACLETFGYSIPGNENTMFYMFNLNSSCEDTFLIRTADRHWIMIDGGLSMYSENFDPEGYFADAIYEFMRDHGLGEKEKPVVSCWYLTHAHRDHFMAFQALLARHADDIILERVIANIPDPQSVTHNSNMADFRKCMEILQKYYPNVPYLKAHEGMQISLADVTFTVLGAQENLLPFWVDNRDRYYAAWRHYGTMDPQDPSYPECRNSSKLYDINNSSLVSVIDINGMTVLELGDQYRCKEWLFAYFNESTLVSDILKTAHHYINAEMCPLFCKFCQNRQIKYSLVNISESLNPQNEISLNEVLNSDQHLIKAQYHTIFGFRKFNGAVEMHKIPASFSWELNARNS